MNIKANQVSVYRHLIQIEKEFKIGIEYLFMVDLTSYVGFLILLF